jgi:hypothetical protein
MNKYIKKNRRKKYINAGMYEPNTIPAGIGTNSTGHIVMEETDPALQQEREAAQQAEMEKLTADAAQTAEDFEAKKIKDKQNLEANASNLKTRFGIGEQIASKGLQFGAKQLGFTAGKNMLSEGTKFASSKLGTKFLGTQFAKKQIARQAVKTGAKQVGKTVGNAASTASKINPWGLGALAGKGVSMLSDDKDATKWNTGEIIGDVGGAAATGAQLGSMLLPGIGTAVGAAGGAIYATAKGLIQRRKARREEGTTKARNKTALRNFNTDSGDQFKSAWARAAAGRHKSKTYSGSDLGRNLPGIG